MPCDFFDPTPEEQNVVLIDAATIQKAQRMIAGCQACSEDAEIPFDNTSRPSRPAFRTLPQCDMLTNQ
jgi:hypothetical protein